jgi:uncharacterized protein
MRFAEDTSSPFSIQSVSEDGVIIDGKRITRSVLVNATTIEDWPPRSVADLSGDDIAQCDALGPEIVIIGTGRTQVFPPVEYIVALQKQGIGVEIMANDAACRTFNVLLSEDRHVLLALMLD